MIWQFKIAMATSFFIKSLKKQSDQLLCWLWKLLQIQGGGGGGGEGHHFFKGKQIHKILDHYPMIEMGNI